MQNDKNEPIDTVSRTCARKYANKKAPSYGFIGTIKWLNFIINYLNLMPHLLLGFADVHALFEISYCTIDTLSSKQFSSYILLVK